MNETTILSYPKNLLEDDIQVTSAAREIFDQLIDDAEEDFSAIRVYVQGGGCGGMEYSMTFAETIFDRDCVVDCDTFKLVIDPVAFNYLQGCEIDYVNDNLNASFVFKNAFQSVGGSGMCSGCGGGGGFE